MTSESTVTDITLGSGGSAVTVHVTQVEEIFNKALTAVTPPQSSANWASGPKDTKIVDLLRVEQRFSVNGYIESADKANLKALFKAGGVFNMTWDGESFNINMDKLSITKGSRQGMQDEREVTFTATRGVDL